MRLTRDYHIRVLWIGAFGFVVERLVTGLLDFRIVWMDAEYGMGVTLSPPRGRWWDYR